MNANFRNKMMIFSFVIVSLTSCNLTNRTMREPNVRVDLNKSDFILSDQLSAEAKTTKIFGIDFNRLFTKEMGSVSRDGSFSINYALIPVIGSYFSYDLTANYALYELMSKNPGYDVVFYPQYETKIVKPIGINLITITTVKTTARLGKLKN